MQHMHAWESHGMPIKHYLHISLVLSDSDMQCWQINQLKQDWKTGQNDHALVAIPGQTDGIDACIHGVVRCAVGRGLTGWRRQWAASKLQCDSKSASSESVADSVSYLASDSGVYVDARTAVEEKIAGIRKPSAAEGLAGILHCFAELGHSAD